MRGLPEDASSDRGVTAHGAPADLSDRLEWPPGGRAMRERERPSTRAAEACSVDRLVRQLGELLGQRARLVLDRHVTGG